MLAYVLTTALAQSRKRNKTGLILAVRLGWRVGRWLATR